MMIIEDMIITQQIEFEHRVFSCVHFLCSFSLPAHLPAADHVMHPRPIRDARVWSDREEQLCLPDMTFVHFRFDNSAELPLSTRHFVVDEDDDGGQ